MVVDDVTVGVAVVVDIGVVNEGLRSQGFGGDACMLGIEASEQGKAGRCRWHRSNRI